VVVAYIIINYLLTKLSVWAWSYAFGISGGVWSQKLVSPSEISSLWWTSFQSGFIMNPQFTCAHYLAYHLVNESKEFPFQNASCISTLKIRPWLTSSDFRFTSSSQSTRIHYRGIMILLTISIEYKLHYTPVPLSSILIKRLISQNKTTFLLNCLSHRRLPT
jgi:hypothetical protein